MFYRAAVLVGLMAVVGCGTKGDVATGQVPVSGTVVDANGKPVGGVELRFYPTEAGKANGSASAGADGKFQVKTSETITGLIPGKYKVTARAGAKGPKVSSKYDEEATTDLLVEVESGKELKIELK